MTNNGNIRQNIVAAVAALAVSTTVILGTVGPVQAGNTNDPVQMIAEQGTNETPSALIA